MADAKTQYGDNLCKIPDDISLSYLLKHETLSHKAKEKGLNYFTQGYVHEIMINDETEDVKVCARCWMSMCKSEAPHTIKITISSSLKRLSKAYCSCKAG